MTEHQWLLRIGNAKRESVTAKKMVFITVTVIAIFPNRIVISDWTLHATVFITDMIYNMLVDLQSDLPVFPHFSCASKHDSHGFLQAFFRMKSFLPDYRVSKVLLDSAHDAMPYY